MKVMVLSEKQIFSVDRRNLIDVCKKKVRTKQKFENFEKIDYKGRKYWI